MTGCIMEDRSREEFALLGCMDRSKGHTRSLALEIT